MFDILTPHLNLNHPHKKFKYEAYNLIWGDSSTFLIKDQIKNEVIEPSAFNHQHHLFLMVISKGLGFTG